jgi:hypothetical protein
MMVAIQNGRLPVSMLVQAANGAPGQLLEAQTAAQWAAMVQAAAAQGVTLRPEPDDGVPSCYRSYDAQVYAKQVQAQGGATAATPGTSNHGLGVAIDIQITSQTLAWLNAHAAQFGFDNAQGQATRPVENWHWVRTRVIANITNTIGGFLMALSDTEQTEVLNGIRQLNKLIQVPDQAYGYPEAINNTLGAIEPLVRDTQARVRGLDPRGDMLQLIMEKLGQPITATVDTAAIAAAIVQAGVGPAVVEALSKALAAK